MSFYEFHIRRGTKEIEKALSKFSPEERKLQNELMLDIMNRLPKEIDRDIIIAALAHCLVNVYATIETESRCEPTYDA